MKSVYERIIEAREVKDNKVIIALDLEAIELVRSDWNKISKKQFTLSQKKTEIAKQKYPHLNDLLVSLIEKISELRK